ncbi:uncharacterized protein PHALS_14584 [Plasmopara halstedii]|uniref:Uncharacterized protein n=1 Tax=Plasmopara halstedii TaxID=4781 RepID=A0A0P1ALD5_PLAHL|nr:uncharacterized protein PHALS_14584 [Plasmopara halstedii]CEG41952.1 hypothetical protein PHALS_14584 [Plasmopara halstedii]|eukprot:XP_024578321.1 hypothetical protein PHALS_14584 [Plasmopara halstedii]
MYQFKEKDRLNIYAQHYAASKITTIPRDPTYLTSVFTSVTNVDFVNERNTSCRSFVKRPANTNMHVYYLLTIIND